MSKKEFDSIEHDDLKVIGQRIKKLRLKLGYTQEELAKKAGYTSRSTINKIEKGLIDITQSKFVLLSKVLGVKPSQLLGWGELWDDVPDVDVKLEMGVYPVEDKNRAGIHLKIDNQEINAELDKTTIYSIILCFEQGLAYLDGEKNE